MGSAVVMKAAGMPRLESAEEALLRIAVIMVVGDSDGEIGNRNPMLQFEGLGFCGKWKWLTEQVKMIFGGGPI